MSLLQEIAAHGLAYCAYNNALTNIDQISDSQKLRIAEAILSDLYHKYDQDNHYSINSALSCADSCIIEVINFIEGAA